MDTFFSGKFNSLFAFLFGVGFTIQLERLLARSSRPLSTCMRRLLVLFLLGAAHGIFCGTGDVLHIYAVLGIVLILLRRASDRLVLVIVILGLLTPTLFSTYQLFTYSPADEQSDRGVIARLENLMVEAHTRGNYADVVRANIEHYKTIYTDVRGFFYP